jgi:hypothetical protein
MLPIFSLTSSGEPFSLNFSTEDNENAGSIQGEIVKDDMLLLPDVSRFKNAIQVF